MAVLTICTKPSSNYDLFSKYDVAYSYRPSSMVCLSVCYDCEPCKTSWTSWDAIWVACGLEWAQGTMYYMGGPDFPHGKGWPIVKYRNDVHVWWQCGLVTSCWCVCDTDEFENVLQHTELFAHLPFDFDSGFIRMQFGKDRSRPVTYTEFTQLLHVSWWYCSHHGFASILQSYKGAGMGLRTACTRPRPWVFEVMAKVKEYIMNWMKVCCLIASLLSSKTELQTQKVQTHTVTIL